jgi:hypothetical protein
MAGAQDTIGDTECEVSAVKGYREAGEQPDPLTAEEIEYARWLMMTDLRQEYQWRANAMCDAALHTIAAEARLEELERTGNLGSSRREGRNVIYSKPQKRGELNYFAIQAMYWAYED